MSDLLWPDAESDRLPRLRGRLGRLHRSDRASATQPPARQAQIFAGMVAEQPIARRNFAPAVIVFGWVGVIAIGFLARESSGLNNDEHRHLNLAWRIGRGDVPYRDFLETHPPLFHYLLGPFVSEFTRATDAPLLELRAAAAGMQLLLLLGGYSVLRRLLPRSAAAWGAGIFLIACPFGRALFDISPDWLALFCLVGVVWSISERPSSAFDLSDRQKLRRAAFAGALAGISAMLTASAWLPLAGIIVWYFASSALGESAEDRRGRLARFTAFLAILCATVAVAIAFLARNGAARNFVTDNFALMRQLPKPLVALEYLRATAPLSAGILSLGVLALVAIVKNWREELVTAGPRGLVGVVALFGAIAFLISPTPDEHSFILLVVFWSTLLAADFGWRLIIEPAKWKSAPTYLAIVIVLLALTQATVLAGAFVAVTWLTLLAMATACCKLSVRSGRPHLRIVAVGVAISAVGLLFTLGTDLIALKRL